MLVLTSNLDFRRDLKYQWKRRGSRLRMIRRPFRTTYFRHGFGRGGVFFLFDVLRSPQSFQKERRGLV